MWVCLKGWLEFVGAVSYDAACGMLCAVVCPYAPPVFEFEQNQIHW